MQITPAFERNKVIPIVFAFNDEYSKYFSVALQSLIDNSSETYFYDVIIFSSDISERNKKLLENMLPQNFSLRFYNLTDFINDSFENIRLEEKSYWSAEIYHRLFIPIVMKMYKRVLYLDSDIVINGDIIDIFKIDFQNKKLLAVTDTISPIIHLQENQSRLKYMSAELGLKKLNKYFNSGMLVFNVENINIVEYESKLLETIKKQNFLFPDQDILNILFENKTLLVSSKWNYCSGVLRYNPNFLEQIDGEYKSDFLNSGEKPIIIHYTSSYKPWNSKVNDKDEIFWKYARITPFYEEILYSLWQALNIDAIKQSFLYSKIKSGRKIALWGASRFLKDFLERFSITEQNVVGIIDKNIEKQGNILGTYFCFSPEEIDKLAPEEVIITIKNPPSNAIEEIKSFINNKYIVTTM